MTRILIVEDHKIVADGIRLMLDGEKTIKIVTDVNNSASMFEVLSKESIDLIIMDINLGNENGIDIVKKLRKTNDTVKILMLTMHGNFQHINAAMHAGANGYLLKSTGKEELLKAITTIISGDKYYSNEVVDSLFQKTKATKTIDARIILSPREIEILKLLAKGMTSVEIGDNLSLSSKTVDTHRRNILGKINAKNTTEAVNYAMNTGLLEDGLN